jgi:hypothetical protein
MALVCQVTDQNTTIKQRKLHRTSPDISRKIVAFDEIVKANNIKSERKVAKLLNLPNSTMQTWRAQKATKEAMEDEIATFFATPAGSTLLSRIVTAIMYNNKCGRSGICGAQEGLRNSGLDKYVATSAGALQNFWLRCEDCILSFKEEWQLKLAEKMKARKITVILDEMFRKRQPCLVAIEAVSNYILLEKFTENRTAETWKKELKSATENLPVTIDQVTSDLCGAIRSLADEYGATHSPDIFHGQYEISKATSGALNSQERASEKAFSEAEENIKKIENRPRRLDLEKKRKQQEDQEEAETIRDVLKAKYEERKKRREKTQEAKKALGKIYHPIDLKTGKIQTAEVVEKQFAEQFKIIEKNAEDAGLAQSCHDRIEKAKRAFALMVIFLNRFFSVMAAMLLKMQLTSEQERFFKEVVFPLSYLNMIWRRLSKTEKERLTPLRESLQQKLQNEALMEEYQEALMRRGKEMAEIFQRSSSCVEGRNGVLSLLMHRFHNFREKTLRVLSVVHNFGVRRTDGTTAAERFFGSKHADLFEHLVTNVRIPAKPKRQHHDLQKRLMGREKRDAA